MFFALFYQSTQTALRQQIAIMINSQKPNDKPFSTLSCYGLRLDIYDSLDAVKPVWLDFEHTALLTPFQTTAWLYQWYAHIGALEKIRPVVVVGHDDSGVLFLLPLQIETGVLRKLSWLGNELCDYNGPLIAVDYALRASGFSMPDIWRQLLKTVNAMHHLQHDYVRLEKMSAQICGADNPMLELGVSYGPSNAYRTPMIGGWDEFYNSKRDGRDRNRDRSSRRKLEEIGPVDLVTPDDAIGIRASVDALITQKSARFDQKGISNFLLRPGYVNFYRALAQEQRDLVHVSQLNVGQIVASTTLGLTFRGGYYYVLNSFAIGQTDRFGSGKLHMRELMKTHIDKGFDAFDFTIGDEAYKMEWCDSKIQLYDHMDASTMKGRAALACLTALQSTKRYIKQTPVLWNTYAKLRGALALRKTG